VVEAECCKSGAVEIVINRDRSRLEFSQSTKKLRSRSEPGTAVKVIVHVVRR
jgi:hypothetical protein